MKGEREKTSSASRHPQLLCLAVALLLLASAQAGAAVNVFDIRLDSFYRALNHDQYQPSKGLRGARKTLIFNEDFLTSAGKFGRHLIAEGDYPDTGEANTSNDSTAPVAI
ncbi:hypothetical protein GOP47_0028984 [Adiantum capillus-veneris]|nr:hypothetical protein GOP47_0028984 [Adiantum capillus-veneris]